MEGIKTADHGEVVVDRARRVTLPQRRLARLQIHRPRRRRRPLRLAEPLRVTRLPQPAHQHRRQRCRAGGRSRPRRASRRTPGRYLGPGRAFSSARPTSGTSHPPSTGSSAVTWTSRSSSDGCCRSDPAAGFVLASRRSTTPASLNQAGDVAAICPGRRPRTSACRARGHPACLPGRQLRLSRNVSNFSAQSAHAETYRRLGAPGPSGASVTYGAHISHSGAQSKPEKERLALVNAVVGWQALV